MVSFLLYLRDKNTPFNGKECKNMGAIKAWYEEHIPNATVEELLEEGFTLDQIKWLKEIFNYT